MRKKKTYRSKKINPVNPEIVRDKVDGAAVFGIDVGKKRMLGAVMGSNGEVAQTVRWSHPEETPERNIA